MNHLQQQAEYRRLKAEYKARLAREEEARQKEKDMLRLQEHAFISHDDLLKAIGCPDTQILSVNPVEGGWKITLIRDT